MFHLIAHFLIKSPPDGTNAKIRRQYGMAAGIVGIVLNLLLGASKLMGGRLISSIAVTADGLNNLTDAVSSIVTLAGFAIASRRADDEHPFGHGRAEYVSGLIVTCLIFFTAFEVVTDSVKKIILQEPSEFQPQIAVLLLLAIAVKMYMCFYNRSLGLKLNSPVLLASARDSVSDAVATLVVLICAAAGQMTGAAIDGWGGLFVGVFIIFQGVDAAKSTLSPLLGMKPDEEFLRKVTEIIRREKEIRGVHDIVVHNYGPNHLMISFHIEVDSSLSLVAAHEIADRTEHRLQEELGCMPVIHIDPMDYKNGRRQELCRRVEEEAAKIAPGLTIHDFQLVDEKGMEKIDFDVSCPYGEKQSDEEIKKKLSLALESFPDIRRDAIVITVDRMGSGQ